MRILLSLPESPFDPTNGAARSMRTIAELMAAAGHEVRCVATTAREHGCDAVYDTRFHRRDVSYSIVDTNGLGTQHWRKADSELEFDIRFNNALNYCPDLLLCYGGHPTDVARYHRAKRASVKIVFGLRNYGYQQRGFFDFCDGVITSSQFLSDWYRKYYGVESTPLPLPIWPEDVIAENREPKYFTAINPMRGKGAMILVAAFRGLAEQRPDIPVMVVMGESTLLDAAMTTNRSDLVIPWQSNPKEIYRQTKVLLVPSVWEEPAGRVIAEAILNGIPPIITDRGGMPEVANGGAIILPLDAKITPARAVPVPLSVAQPWIDTIIRLHDDAKYYAECSAMAKDAAMMYHTPVTTALYQEYFERILAGQPVAERREPIHSLTALEQFSTKPTGAAK